MKLCDLPWDALPTCSAHVTCTVLATVQMLAAIGPHAEHVHMVQALTAVGPHAKHIHMVQALAAVGQSCSIHAGTAMMQLLAAVRLLHL